MNEITADFHLHKVYLYKNSATFEYTCKVECGKGSFRILLKNLPKSIKTDSIRVSGSGYGKIVNIGHRKDFSEEGKLEKIAGLEDLLKKLQDERTKLTFKLEELETIRKSGLNAVEKFADCYPKWFSIGKIDLDKIAALDDFIIEKINPLKDKIVILNGEIRKKDEEIRAVKRELDELNGSMSDDYSYTVFIDLETEKSGVFGIKVNIDSFGAYWDPFYDIIIDEKGDVFLNYIAHVFNGTGMDWKNVLLEISTATNEPIKIEKPDPFIVDEAVRVYAKRAPQKKMLAMAAVPPPSPLPEAAAPVEKELPEMKKISAETGGDYGVQLYTFTTPFDIEAGSDPKPIPLHTEKLESTVEYVWSVLIPDKTLCRNKVKNGDRIIPPGAAKVYVGNTFIGETSLKAIYPYEEFYIGDRVTFAVKVEKKLRMKQKQKEGAFKGKRAVTYRYEIIIKNLSAVEEFLYIFDRIPYSTSEKIKIKIDRMSDEPEENNMNVIVWKIPLKGVKEKRLDYQFTVIYEKDTIIEPPLP